MDALVVYESYWGNTAAIAKAIAEGMGTDARAVTTDEATAELVASADLIVAGAPLLGFNLPTEQMRKGLADQAKAPAPADTSHPLLRTWLDALPHGNGYGAAFETRLRLSPGSAAKKIASKLERAGYRQIAPPERFIVTGTYGPLKDGELERARAWGADIAARL